jgi:DNA processing protein
VTESIDDPVSSFATLTGPTLPHRLADLPDPPQTLYVRGELPRGPSTAIVGTRHPTLRGARFAAALAEALVREGVAVFSGGAEGIDTAAHLGALRGRGQTAVIAPASFDVPYPATNAALFQRVLDAGGAYAALVPDGTPATQAAFFPRNACLVALAHVVVVVEAGFRSGAANAARWARDIGRPLLVVPHAPWSEKGKGCLVELRRGALLCEGPRDVLRELERLLLRPLPTARKRGLRRRRLEHASGPGAELERVRDAVASGANNVDEVSERTGLPVPEVQRHVLTLTLSGVLAPDRSGRLALVLPGPGSRDEKT